MKNLSSGSVAIAVIVLLVSGCTWLDKGLEDDPPLTQQEVKLEKEKRELEKKIADLEKSKLEERIESLEKEKAAPKASSGSVSQPKQAATAVPQSQPQQQNQVNNRQRRAYSPADGWLALRAQANSGSRLIVKIPHGTVLNVGSCTKRVRSGKLRGRWCRVTYKNMSGWAFDYYLR
jgi:hypothetical protein